MGVISKRLEIMAKITKGKTGEVWIVSAPNGYGGCDILGAFSDETTAWDLLAHALDETSPLFSPGADVYYLELNRNYYSV